MKRKHVFLIGAKSIGAYGGYETFIDKLTEYHKNDGRIKYHIACKANGSGYMDENTLEGISRVRKNKKGEVTEFTYHNAHCFKLRVPEVGSAQAIIYDIMALRGCLVYVKKKHIEDFIVYIMACRIGPFMKRYVNRIHALGGKVYINPDGHEWLRAKWSKPIRFYWKKSEQLMVKHADKIICDSLNIEKYINNSYKKYKPQTEYIAYGAELLPSINADERYEKWLQEKSLEKGNYYLVVGRFVPENNYETMIREFMRSSSKRDLAIITNADGAFSSKLEEKLHFNKDQRIKFVGTVYDAELLKKIREEAFCYLHGHEVGGTNPSLLEALSSTKLNLLLDVGFNREVAEDAAIYWNKESGNLAMHIENADKMETDSIEALGKKAKQRIRSAYSWDYISSRYLESFLSRDN